MFKNEAKPPGQEVAVVIRVLLTQGPGTDCVVEITATGVVVTIEGVMVVI